MHSNWVTRVLIYFGTVCYNKYLLKNNNWYIYVAFDIVTSGLFLMKDHRTCNNTNSKFWFCWCCCALTTFNFCKKNPHNFVFGSLSVSLYENCRTFQNTLQFTNIKNVYMNKNKLMFDWILSQWKKYSNCKLPILLSLMRRFVHRINKRLMHHVTQTKHQQYRARYKIIEYRTASQPDSDSYFCFLPFPNFEIQNSASYPKLNFWVF